MSTEKRPQDSASLIEDVDGMFVQLLSQGMDLFLHCIKHDLLERARFLIDAGFDVNNFKDEEGMNLLSHSIKLRKTDFFNLILEHVSDVNTCSHEGITALHAAAALGDAFYSDSEYFIKSLVERGANVEAMTNNKKTPLHFAVESGPPPKVKLFLDYGTNPKLPEYDDLFDIASTLTCQSMRTIIDDLMDHGFTAGEHLVRDSGFLCNAVDGGCFRLVEDLLQRGADPNKKVDGLSILQAACISKHKDLVKLLIDFGVELKSCDDALVAAVFRSEWDIVEILLNSGVPRKMSHLLYVAIKFCRVSMLESLLRYEQPSFNVNSMLGARTLTKAAIKRSDPRIVEILWEFGMDLNQRGEFGNPHLQSAVWDANPEIVKALLNIGADVNATNKFGHTPPETIPHYCPPEAATYLREHIAALHSAGLYVCPSNISFMEATGDPNIQSKYLAELELLKNTIIPNTRISFYKVLKCTSSEIANLCKNLDIIKILSQDYQQIFPNYFNLLQWKMKTGLKRRTLMDEFLAKLLPTMGPFVHLPWNCVQSILSFFSIEELGIMLGHFEPRKIISVGSVHHFTRFYRIFPRPAKRKQERPRVLTIPSSLK